MSFKNLLVILGCLPVLSFGQFAPHAGEVGTSAIHKDSSVIIAWASQVFAFERGLEDIVFPAGLYASFGDSSQALGYAEGTSVDVVSLGDQGSITLLFEYAIKNGDGPDFIVFENSFSDLYLEFAHVEVSSDGENFVRFPSVSNIQTDVQTATYGNSNASLVHNLAGKYRQGFGTPFDLQDLVDSVGIDLMDVKFVRIIDVVGSIDPLYGSYDSQGHLINDPYPTDFESGGFDLDAVGVIHNTDPAASLQEKDEFSVKIYPNPTQNVLNINVKGEIEQTRIYDLSGKLILTMSNENQILLCNYQLAKGMYLLEVKLLNGIVIRQQFSYN